MTHYCLVHDIHYGSTLAECPECKHQEKHKVKEANNKDVFSSAEMRDWRIRLYRGTHRNSSVATDTNYDDMSFLNLYKFFKQQLREDALEEANVFSNSVKLKGYVNPDDIEDQNEEFFLSKKRFYKSYGRIQK